MRRAGDKLAQHLSLVVVVGDVQRPRSVVPQSAGTQHLEPDLEAAPARAGGAGRGLSDRPEHAEVAIDAPSGAWPAFTTTTFRPAPRKSIGVGQPEMPAPAMATSYWVFHEVGP